MSERRSSSWAALLVPVPFLVVAAALQDWFGIPGRLRFESAFVALHSAALAIARASVELYPFVVLQVTLCFAAWALASRPNLRRSARVLMPVCALLIALLGHLVLIEYRPFAGYLPFIAASVVLAAYLALAYFATVTPTKTLWRVGLILAGAVASLMVLYLSSSRFAGRYLTLHLWAMMTAYAAAHAAASVALVASRVWAVSARPALYWTLPPVALIAAALATSWLAAPSAGTVYFREHTVLGRSSVLRSDARPADDPCLSPPAPMPDAEALAVFSRHSGLPPLPADFALADYNVLLISIDAVRYDQTSFAGSWPTTPHLAAFAQRGAFVFERAYAPSTRTWLSLAGVFAMTYPSHVDVVTTMPRWTGDITDDVTTVAEAFAAAGRDTFALHPDFDSGVAGIDQGFASVHSEPRQVVPKQVVDENLTERALDKLDEYAASGRAFFGFVSLYSPHAPYLRRPEQPPSMVDDYRYSIAIADGHVARIVDRVEQRGLLDRTVIIVMSDHGEQLGEHGGHGIHGVSVHSEESHVPLLIWIPGVKGRSIAAPTSLAYVFPWLLLRGTDSVRRAALERVRDDIAPMMRATDGAVVVELLDWHSLRTSLVYPRYKVDYNQLSGMYELFDLDEDPLEQADLFRRRRDLAEVYRQHVLSYRAVRACGQRMQITDESRPSNHVAVDDYPQAVRYVRP